MMNCFKKIIILTLFFSFFKVYAANYTVLIDPGHGGEDYGAEAYYFKKGLIGNSKKIKVQEKDVNLELAKEIFKRLKKKKYNVFLTRSFDRDVTLGKRAEVAEKIKADLFISIHANSFKDRSSSGFETYYLDNHNDAAVRKVEDIENKGVEGEDLLIKQILIDLVIGQTVSSSKKLAHSIHSKLQINVGRRYQIADRGIRPGLFYVLALSKRPAVLLEVGFMSNPDDLKKITTEEFQDRYAQAVAEGVEEYFKKNVQLSPALF